MVTTTLPVLFTLFFSGERWGGRKGRGGGGVGGGTSAVEMGNGGIGEGSKGDRGKEGEVYGCGWGEGWDGEQKEE